MLFLVNPTRFATGSQAPIASPRRCSLKYSALTTSLHLTLCDVHWIPQILQIQRTIWNVIVSACIEGVCCFKRPAIPYKDCGEDTGTHS
ncbi:hypothetical protein SKAU_G00219960 [Synaphobranchus kaupii]|uniref:Uncharacterized protein n=1 Tax=Synaphobranchus kaupii TaxID=118154 RepID=A0A9Q1FAF4_SYNKA|nr:hypothetical protein SKAU_G00219960 [Synaphobranchus kaupii]